MAAKPAGAGICMCRVWRVMLRVIVAALMEKVPSIEALVANDLSAVETVKGFTELAHNSISTLILHSLLAA